MEKICNNIIKYLKKIKELGKIKENEIINLTRKSLEKLKKLKKRYPDFFNLLEENNTKFFFNKYNHYLYVKDRLTITNNNNLKEIILPDKIFLEH